MTPKKGNVLEAVARAMWNSQRESEIKALSEIELDTEYIKMAGGLMVGSSLRTQVLIGFSAISKSLALRLRVHLSHSSERDRREMLEGMGPLATDAAKMRLARLMGWLPLILDQGLSCIRRSRNLIAHDIVGEDKIEFPSNLPGDTKSYLDAMIKRMIDAANSTSESIVAEHRKEHDAALYALILSNSTLNSIAWGPSRIQLGMQESVFSILQTEEEAPKWYRESNLNLAAAMLSLSQLS